MAAQFPSGKRARWIAKSATRTIERDREVTDGLVAQGWTVIRLWESEVPSGR